MPPKPAIPAEFRFGSISFPIFELADGRVGFKYKAGSRWKSCKRRTVERLKQDAERVALLLTQADSAVGELSAQEGRIYLAAKEALGPLGIDLDRGARILAEAIGITGSVERVTEACRWFANVRPVASRATTEEVRRDYIRNLAGDGLSEVYVAYMEKDLETFATAFPGVLAECKAAAMDDWLRTLPVGLLRRRKLRANLVSFFNFAKAKGVLPDSMDTEAEKIKRPKVTRKAPAIYTPEEFARLLAVCEAPARGRGRRMDYRDFLPTLWIGAFAGLRWSELLGLDWQRDVHLAQGIITVGEEEKTGYRPVVMQANLRALLATCAGRMGKVCPVDKPDTVVRRLGKRAGLPAGGRRYANALRHSYVSYRMALVKNAPMVAEESGHSISELKKSYNRPQLEPAGKLWFSLGLPAENVVAMPAAGAGQ